MGRFIYLPFKISRGLDLAKRGGRGKKWGKYKKSVGKEKPVPCVYCGRLVPRSKAVVVERGMPLGDLVRELDRDQIMVPRYKAYACISCAKHRRILK